MGIIRFNGGTVSDSELLFLVDIAKDKECLEIGTYMGASAINMLQTCKSLIVVDNWTGSKTQPEQLKEFELAKLSGRSIFRHFLSNLEKREAADKVKAILQMDSGEAECLLCDYKCDLVFIDADHSFEGVKRDIELWKPHVRSGGIICGHDYINGESRGWDCTQIVRAVHELLGKPNKVIDTIWVHYA